ncbi:unnamed protein product, partial [Coregonus sp. 'balchen']
MDDVSVCILAAAQSSEIHLVTANVGETVTLHCFYKGNLARYFMWYKQTMGDNPQILSVFYKYNKNATFYHEFKGNTRFSVQSGEGMNHLKISDMQLSDSATYYCGNSYANQVEFEEGAILIVKGSGSRNMSVLQQPVSESVQPGDSVTLNCTIHTETCAGEHSVYWFRHGSGESRPGIIYINGDRHDQVNKEVCSDSQPDRAEKIYTQNSQTVEVRTGDTITLQCSNVTTVVGHTAWFKQVNGSEPVCISSMYGFNSTPDLHNGFQRSHLEMFSNNTSIFLKITKVEIADCGLYFCGLHPHSHMLFVNATVLKIQGEDDDGTMYLLPLVVILGVVTAVLLIVVLILVLKIIREAKTHNTGPDSQRQPQNDQNQDPDALNYSALNFTSKKRKMERRREKELDPHVEEGPVRVCITSCGVSDRKVQLSV